MAEEVPLEEETVQEASEEEEEGIFLHFNKYLALEKDLRGIEIVSEGEEEEDLEVEGEGANLVMTMKIEEEEEEEEGDISEEEEASLLEEKTLLEILIKN